MNNTEVCRAWSESKAGQSGTMSTNGNDLYSYGLKIGETVEGKKVLYDYSRGGGHFVSQTTSKHVLYHAIGYADEVKKPPAKFGKGRVVSMSDEERIFTLISTYCMGCSKLHCLTCSTGKELQQLFVRTDTLPDAENPDKQGK